MENIITMLKMLPIAYRIVFILYCTKTFICKKDSKKFLISDIITFLLVSDILMLYIIFGLMGVIFEKISESFMKLCLAIDKEIRNIIIKLTKKYENNN